MSEAQPFGSTRVQANNRRGRRNSPLSPRRNRCVGLVPPTIIAECQFAPTFGPLQRIGRTKPPTGPGARSIAESGESDYATKCKQVKASCKVDS
jgi:hypothetical protein